MKSLLFHCKSCGRYTLYSTCPDCGEPAVQPAPPRFSPEDKYGKYRRMLKKESNANDIV